MGTEKMMKAIVFACCLVLVCAVAEESLAVEGGAGDCGAQAHAVTAGCRSKVTTARAAAKKACGGRDPDAVLAKLKRLKDLARRQEEALKRGEKALAKMRAEAARLAKMSAAERAKLKAALLKQKSGQKGLTAAQKACAKDVRKWKELRQKADAATSAAVTVARDKGQKAAKGASAKAHKLYTAMVNEKVRVASCHHKVITARSALAKLSKEVEKEIGVAKKTAVEESTALKKVAKDRNVIAIAAEKEAQAQFDSMNTKTSSANNIEKGFKSNLNGAKGDLSTSKKTLKNAEGVENKAKKAEGKIGMAKVGALLTMKKIREEAHKIAAGQKDMPSANKKTSHDVVKEKTKTSSHKKVTLEHKKGPNGNSHVHVHVSKDKKVQVHSHGVSSKTHQKYADKVKVLEKHRLAAQAKFKAEESKLATLKKHPGANKASIASTQAAMHAAQSKVQKLAQQQQSAVENAVNLVNKP